MSTIYKYFFFLLIVGVLFVIFSGIIVYFEKWKKKHALFAILAYGLISFIILLALFLKRQKPSKQYTTDSMCQCTMNSLKLKKNDFSLHKASSKKISNGRYILNDKLEQQWLSAGHLEDVDDNEGFKIDKLEQSRRFLTPLAKQRLYELGRRFHEAIENKKEQSSYFLVSSLTRTVPQQEEVKTKYSNAATKDHSPHSYGAAFDISKVISTHKNCSYGMKTLEKILKQMQKEGKILLCPEGNCIHVTVSK